jgi:peptide/nickel transport system substrate-binding protein
LKKEGSTAYDLFLGGYIMGMDPDQRNRLFKTGGASNYFKLASREVDSLFEQGAAEIGSTKREQMR